MPDVACVSTKGSGSNEEDRIVDLLAAHSPHVLPFDKGDKRESARALWRALRRERPALLVMEGTGTAGGAVAMLARLALGVPYVVSSGDAVGPFIGMRSRALRPAGEAYERLLYRLSAGFIGWTPYMTGRALSLGAPRGVTAVGWAPHPARVHDRAEVRRRFGIADDALVIGLVGSLHWEPRRKYCYGLELVRAMRHVTRKDVVALIVGEGTGLDRLRAEAGQRLGSSVLLPGSISQTEVVATLAACDVGSLPQSRDLVGALRYTTKLSEYLDARLPVVTGRLPFAYDIGFDWCWRVGGGDPWTEEYARAVAQLLDGLAAATIAQKRAAIAPGDEFERGAQAARVAAFVADVLDELC